MASSDFTWLVINPSAQPEDLSVQEKQSVVSIRKKKEKYRNLMTEIIF